MFFHDIELINERFYCDFVPPEGMDALWSDGWRHFGPEFFRYNLGFHSGQVRQVLPLRIRLADLSFTKSQRRNLRRNTAFHTSVVPLELTPESHSLFDRHRTRFVEGIPESLTNFVPPSAEHSPCETWQLRVFNDERLIAESYFDIGDKAASGIFAIFDPELTAPGLGIFTMLKEIDLAAERGLQYYYLGYAYEGESFYDYKKRFRGSECFDWKGSWKPFSAETITDVGGT